MKQLPIFNKRDGIATEIANHLQFVIKYAKAIIPNSPIAKKT